MWPSLIQRHVADSKQAPALKHHAHLQVAHIFQRPMAHLDGFDALNASLRRAAAAASVAAGCFPGYAGAAQRLSARLAVDLASDARRLAGVSFYTSAQGAAAAGDASGILAAIDAYLEE
jgi:hypothetical protein